MRRLPARLHLLGIIAAAVVPLWLFGAYLLGQYALTERQRYDREALQVARTISLIVEGHLGNLLTVVEGLAKSSALENNDLEQFREEARRLVNRTDRVIALQDLGGRHLFSTNVAYGTTVPAIPFSPRDIENAKAGQRIVSGVFPNPVSDEYRIAIGLPIRSPSNQEWLLAITIPTNGLRDIMLPAVPEGWIIGIGDRDGRYVARSQMHEQMTGKPGLPEYLNKVVGSSGTFTSQNFQGLTLLAGYYRSNFSGWFYSANVPLKVVQAPLWKSVVAIAFAGLAAVLFSAALAYVAGDRFAKATAALASRAKELGQGKPVATLTTSVREFGIVADSLIAAERTLSERSNELQAVLETVPVAVWFTYDPNGREVIRNRFAAELMGLPGDTDRHFGAPDLVIDTMAFHDGREVSREDRPLTRAMRGEQTDNQEFTYVLPSGLTRILLTSARSIRDSKGNILGAVQVSLDISERHRAEEHRRLLVRELNHRVKNTLAVVQSIANQTLRGASDLREANSALSSRLASLAQAHDILTHENWSGAELEEVVGTSIRPHEEIDRFEITGPPVRLRPSLALSLAMAFHELATNAIKYGALSNNTGRVSISWTLKATEGKRRLRIKWKERGGPPVQPTDRKGFGTRMLRQILSSEPGGSVEMGLDEAGLVCIFKADLPLDGGKEAESELASLPQK